MDGPVADYLMTSAVGFIKKKGQRNTHDVRMYVVQ